MTRPGLLAVYKMKPQRAKALVCERFVREPSQDV
jgi:hypothetical protein